MLGFLGFGFETVNLFLRLFNVLPWCQRVGDLEYVSYLIYVPHWSFFPGPSSTGPSSP